MTDHFVEVRQKVLSPNAMTVLDAFLNGYICNSINNNVAFQADRNGLAAAIRVLADQVVPAEQHPPRRGMRPGGTGALSPDEGAEDQRAATRRRLLAIATELEGTNA